MRVRQAEAQGICSRSPVVDERRVPYGKSNCRRLRFGDFGRFFLPERTFAARRTVSGRLRGETKSGAVISDDMISKWKLIWSQVAAGLRSPFRQKGSTSAHTFHRHDSSRVLKKAAPVVVDLPPEPSSEAQHEHLCPNCSLPLHGVSRTNRPGWSDVMNGPLHPDWYDDA